jgi:hypothetical protein
VSGWVTVYDVAAEPFRWGGAGEGLWALSSVFMGVAASRALLRRSTIAAAAALTAALAVAGAVLWQSLEHRRSHLACVEASRHDAGRVLEGVVRDYRPLASHWDRPGHETFRVSGETVRLKVVSDGCGYHRTSLDGGPIREGMRVRLHAWEGQILRVELDRDAVLGVADANPFR